MSRFENLEKEFDLPRLEDCVQQSQQELDVMQAAQDLHDKFDMQDPFELHDTEMDEIAQLAVTYGKDLHDLGMNAEVKHAGEIFSASSNMLKIAVDARNLKMEKKLKLMKLELDRLKLDRSTPDPQHAQSQENVTVLDRNALLAEIRTITNTDTK